MRRLRWSIALLIFAVAWRPLVAGAQTAAAPSTPPPPRMSGYVQVRETGARGTGLSATLNRVRLILDGALPSRFGYRVAVEYEAPGAATAAAAVSLRDAYVRWSAAPWSVTAGQFKTPFSREYVTPITTIETAERSAVVKALAPKRDIGVMGEVAKGTEVTLSAGLFNGEGQNAALNRDSTLLVVSRLVLRPLSQIGLAGDFAAYGPDSTRYGGELNLEQSGFALRGEYVQQWRELARRYDRGWYAVATYRVLPWLQLVAKQEEFDHPVAQRTAVYRATTGGANAEMAGGRVRLIMNGISRRVDLPGPRETLWIAQLQARL